jgi:hypothetical protein
MNGTYLEVNISSKRHQYLVFHNIQVNLYALLAIKYSNVAQAYTDIKQYVKIRNHQVVLLRMPHHPPPP